MADITFNISGGNNQILPNATHAEQNFYGDDFVPHPNNSPQGETYGATPQEHLARYIGNRQLLDSYIARLEQCTKAGTLADILVDMAINDNASVSKYDIVKGSFIELLLSLCPKFRTGKSISNIRQRVNDRIAKLPREKRGGLANY